MTTSPFGAPSVNSAVAESTILFRISPSASTQFASQKGLYFSSPLPLSWKWLTRSQLTSHSGHVGAPCQVERLHCGCVVAARFGAIRIALREAMAYVLVAEGPQIKVSLSLLAPLS